ncbi:inositol monophosphatase family protein [Atopobacter phocae]|uniref:inositol monophosphatase family protein n=1 Tax=Atopobacter phocae TaxID=136492 RepID=UPI00046F7B51|nr:inositol monophosphatase family protein [Atopobacter phocae]
MNNEIIKRLELGKEWILSAHDFLMNHLNDPLVVEEKKDRTDVVTQLDKEVEERIVSNIRQYFPNDRILGEEQTAESEIIGQGNEWILDPIDGTMNFVQGQRQFGMMLAFYQEGIGQFGMIVEGGTGNILVAIKGEGVYWNDRRITPTDLSVENSLVEMSARVPIHRPQLTRYLIEESLGIRITGAASLCTIAIVLGTRSSYISSVLAPWDTAVARIIFKEFGFHLTTWTGEELPLMNYGPVLMASSAAYPTLLNALEIFDCDVE